MEGIIHHKCLGLKVRLLLLGPTTIIRHQRSINPELDFFLMITCHSETLLGTGMAVVHISAEMVTTIITMGAGVIRITVEIRTGIITEVLMVETTLCLRDLVQGL